MTPQPEEIAQILDDLIMAFWEYGVQCDDEYTQAPYKHRVMIDKAKEIRDLLRSRPAPSPDKDIPPAICQMLIEKAAAQAREKVLNRAWSLLCDEKDTDGNVHWQTIYRVFESLRTGGQEGCASPQRRAGKITHIYWK